MRNRMLRAWLLLLLLVLGLPAQAADPLAGVPTLAHRVLERRAHDPTLFTQGMAFHGDELLESGGNYGASRVLARSLGSSTPRIQAALPRTWFGEGLAVHEGRAVVLTWKEGIAQEFALPGLERRRRFAYRGEGWGLTSDGAALIQSDGSARLVWRDPRDFRELRSLTVLANGRPVQRLNELEWVDGWVLGNVWGTDSVVAIDPADGHVAWKLDLSGLLSAKERRQASVTNGLAWHAPTRTLWASGKNWPWMFALALEIPPLPARAP